MIKSEILQMLNGNDRRTITQVDSLAKKLHHGSKRIRNLYHLLSHEDTEIVFRASDALEKILKSEPKLTLTVSKQLGKDWPSLIVNEALQMHLPLILGYVSWKKNDAARISTSLLELAHTTKNKFVCVNAMTGLTDIAMQHIWLMPTVWGLLEEMETKGSAALKARSRILKKKIQRNNKL